MLTMESMELLSIAVLKDKAESVVSRLLKTGLFHPVDIRDVEASLADLSRFQIDKEFSSYEALESRLSGLSRKMRSRAVPGQEIKNYSYADIDKFLGDAEAAIDPLVERKEDLGAELKTKESMLSQLETSAPFSIDRPASAHTFLKVEVGRLEEKSIPLLQRNLKDVPHIIYPFGKEDGKALILFMGLRRDKELLDGVLRDIGWQKAIYSHEPSSLAGEVRGRIKKEIGLCKESLKDVDSKLEGIRGAFDSRFSDAMAFILVRKSLLEAKRYSCSTDRTALLSGWVPAKDKDRLIKEIKAIDSSSYIENKAAEDTGVPREEIPVRLNNAPLFRPFELLINAYGIPRYGTIDPTIFVAISFLLMFGAMFGDSGHGIVLSMISLFLWRSKKEKVKQAATLIFYCGMSSEVFGLLYGSFFGYEFPSIWIKPMHSIITIFKVSVLFGVIMITTGILLNIVNALRDKDYIKALFDKAGLIAGVIYWAGIAVISKLLVSKSGFQPVYITVMLVCVILLFFKPLAEFIVKKKRESIVTSFMESTIDILEIIMGYLANTVSFIRIAAFALAHTGLFLSIFELSRLLKGVGGGVVSLIVIMLGNVLVILLEGLVVSIQSLRLNYYEFFSKFFVSGKKLYKPLSM